MSWCIKCERDRPLYCHSCSAEGYKRLIAERDSLRESLKNARVEEASAWALAGEKSQRELKEKLDKALIRAEKAEAQLEGFRKVEHPFQCGCRVCEGHANENIELRRKIEQYEAALRKLDEHLDGCDDPSCLSKIIKQALSELNGETCE